MLSVEPWPRMFVASSVARVGVTWGRRWGAAFPPAGRWARCVRLPESAQNPPFDEPGTSVPAPARSQVRW